MLKTISSCYAIFHPKVKSQHKRYLSTNLKNAQNPNNIFLCENSINDKYYCIIHKKKYSLFCSTCNKDICFLCEKSHRDHDMYNYKDFIPTEKEINLLKKQ